MQIVRTSEDLTRALAELRASGSLALVPTMGALHRGHLALVAEAKRRADRVVATIFVNPMQFGAGEDLERYPRREKADSDMLEQAGCDLLWIPSAGDIYPHGFATTVSVRGLGDRWEGAARPGHFDGVATVVAKLLLAVRPAVAVFGEKDFQQLAVIRRMADDLGLGAAIAAVPTVREADGLALSSRNAYLSPDQRRQAPGLAAALHVARDAIRSGQPVAAALATARQSIESAGFAPIDYVALVDAASLEPLDEPRGAMRLVAAATVGGTRLIDNIAVTMDRSPHP